MSTSKQTKNHRVKTMAKKISSLRIRENRAELLREKAIELTVKKKEVIKESEIINYLIDEFTERVDIERWILYKRRRRITAIIARKKT
jgi:hypothetical protein